MTEKATFEKMLKYLNALPAPRKDGRKNAGAYSDEENQQFADYIRGKLTLEDVRPLIKPLEGTTTYDERTFLFPGEQYDEARRFLLLVRLADVYETENKPDETEYRLAFTLNNCNAALPSEEQIDLADYYVTYHLGIGTLLSDMSSMIYSRRHSVYKENFGIGDYAAYIDALYEKYGDEEFAHFEEGADNYFVKAYLYARNPDKYKDFGSEIAQYAATEHYNELTYKQLVFAFVHSPRNALMDQMLCDLLKYDDNFNVNAWDILAYCHKGDDFVPAMKALIADGFFTAKEAILHYAEMAEDVQAVADFVAANEAFALEVAAENEDLYLVVMVPLWQCGKHLDQLRAIEDAFIANVLGDQKVKGFEDYVTAKTDVVPKSKKATYMHSKEETCRKIARASEVPLRLCNYLFVNNLYDELRALDCVLQFVRSGRVAITTSCFERVNEYLADREAKYRLKKEKE